MIYKIGDDCVNCGACAAACPVSCIKAGATKHEINSKECIGCGTCAQICPYGVPKPVSESN